MLDERIDRMLDGHVVLQRLDVFDQHLGIECLGVVVVELRALLVGQFGMSLVVIIVTQRGDIVASEGFLQPFDERRFSGAGSTGNSDDGNFHEVKL